MKVVHLNTYNTGGAAKACLRLHNGLREQGVDSKVLLLYKTEDSHEVYDHRDSLLKAKALALKVKNYAFERKVQSDIKRICDVFEFFSAPESVWQPENNPMVAEADVIHLHWVARFINYPTFFASLKKPIVWTLHDFNPFTGGFHYHFGFDLEPFKHIYKRNIAVKKEALNKANITCVTPSKYLSEQSKTSEINSRFDHVIIGNGVNTDHYKYKDKLHLKRELGLPVDKQILLFVSDVIEYERKGFSVLVDALTNVKFECELAIVGNSNKRIEIPGYKVHEFGQLKDEQLAKVYGAADVYVNPTLADISSNTVMESLCCGTPVVVFPTGGVPELVDRVNGAVCTATDSDQLAIAIEQALDKEWNRNEIAHSAASRFSCERMTCEYIELYNSSIS